TGNHTGEDVNVYAYGPGSDYFRGWHENAETGQLLKILAAGLSPDDDNY
ncbi:alkaline phosphatase, partial [Aerococcus urinaeequi]